MSGRPRVVVVGAGVYGAGTALELADAGASVTLIDARAPGHEWAASSGHSRVLRVEYGADLYYTRLAAAAREAWRALEVRLGVALYHEVGVLALETDDQAEGPVGWAQQSFETVVGLGFRPERIEPNDVSRRFPAISSVGVRFASFHAVGGFLAARTATVALVEAARAAGAALCFGQAVVAVEFSGGRATGVRLEDGTSLPCEAVVLAPGAFALRLCPALGIVPPRVTRQVICYAPAPSPHYAAPALPVFAELASGCYGVPAWRDEPALKIAAHLPGPTIDPGDASARDATRDTLDVHRAYVAQRFPALAGLPLSEPHVCCYDMTPDEHFLIGRVPAAANVIVATGFSGHGFKFASALTPAIAQLALGEEPAIDLARFRPDRAMPG